MAYSVTRSYVEDFGNARLAVVERQEGPRCIKTSTEVLKGEATADTWRRLEKVLNEATEWLEAQ